MTICVEKAGDIENVVTLWRGREQSKDKEREKASFFSKNCTIRKLECCVSPRGHTLLCECIVLMILTKCVLFFLKITSFH